VNAVAHRDYTVKGPVRLFIFDDRIATHPWPSTQHGRRRGYAFRCARGAESAHLCPSVRCRAGDPSREWYSPYDQAGTAGYWKRY
jgi:hypothetical protein